MCKFGLYRLFNHREYSSCNSLCLFLNIQFVASAKCESILNEVVYFGRPSWQKEKRIPKILWSFFVHLPFIFIPLCIPYTIYRAFKDCLRRDQGEPNRWKLIRRQFEHPYSKFVNHTISYVVFLAFLIAASFEDTFGRTWIGLEWIGEKYLIL